VVEGAVVVELKASEEMPALYSAQLLTYLKSAQKRVGLLINFNVPVLKQGLKRVINDVAEDPLCLCASVSKDGH
jgi:GxxExxY protein